MSTMAAKIIALIAKADSTTSEAEADTFMRKAHDLLTKEGLTLQELGRLSEDPIGSDDDAVTHPARYAWGHKVGSALAGYYGVRFLRRKVGKAMVYEVFGRESARITFCIMFPFVIRQVLNLANKATAEGVYTRRSIGASRTGAALAHRIWDMVPDKEDDTRLGNGVNALVPVDLIEQLMGDDHRAPRKSRLKTDLHAMLLAQQVSLETQLTEEELEAQLKLGAA